MKLGICHWKRGQTHRTTTKGLWPLASGSSFLFNTQRCLFTLQTNSAPFLCVMDLPLECFQRVKLHVINSDFTLQVIHVSKEKHFGWYDVCLFILFYSLFVLFIFNLFILLVIVPPLLFLSYSLSCLLFLSCGSASHAPWSYFCFKTQNSIPVPCISSCHAWFLHMKVQNYKPYKFFSSSWYFKSVGFMSHMVSWVGC